MIHKYSVELAGPGGPSERDITVEKLDGNRVRVTHAGRTRVYDAVRIAGNGRASSWSLMPEGGGATALIDVDGAAPDLNVTVDNVTVPLKLQSARAKVAGRAAPAPKVGPASVQSPMPGKVGVVVVEAMKMENELKAPKDGKVKAVSAKEGQPVEAGQTLITLE